MFSGLFCCMFSVEFWLPLHIVLSFLYSHCHKFEDSPISTEKSCSVTGSCRKKKAPISFRYLGISLWNNSFCIDYSLIILWVVCVQLYTHTFFKISMHVSTWSGFLWRIKVFQLFLFVKMIPVKPDMFFGNL